MTSPKLLALIAIVGLACSCGGQKQTGNPNDPNEQQGNPKAQPEKSVTDTTNKQPSDNQAGRNAHNGKAKANDNK